MSRIWPGDIEQTVEMNGVIFRGIQQARSIVRMNLSFVAGKETSADPCARSAKRQYRRQTTTISDAASRNHGHRWNRIHNRRDQRQCSHRAFHVPARLPTLRYDDVYAAFDSGDGLACGAHGMNDNRTASFRLRN